MPPDLTPILQFGVAGIVAWMWLTERRSAAIREKQLADAHDRLLAERTSLAVVLRALESSTRVLTGLELGQRQLLDLLARATGSPRLSGRPSHHAPPAASADAAPTSLPRAGRRTPRARRTR